MISLIVCTAKEDIGSLEQNVRQTIGLEHECIVVRNKGQYSLTQAYNMAAKLAKYELLCFVHDDIHILTQGWGEKLISHYKDYPETSLLGVIGTQYKSVFPSPWTSPDISKNKGKVWQNDKRKSANSHLLNYSDEPTPIPVVMVDGMFLFTSKSSLVTVGYFDEALIGFHCYDIDLAMSFHFKGLKIYVTNAIELEHFSKGRLNEAWFMNQIYLYRKWKQFMPANVRGISRIDFSLELKSLKRSVFVMVKNKARLSTKIHYLICVFRAAGSLLRRKIQSDEAPK